LVLSESCWDYIYRSYILR